MSSGVLGCRGHRFFLYSLSPKEQLRFFRGFNLLDPVYRENFCKPSLLAEKAVFCITSI